MREIFRMQCSKRLLDDYRASFDPL
jgi:hypothetical protein